MVLQNEYDDKRDSMEIFNCINSQLSTFSVTGGIKLSF